jgi:pentatricopeptide repeat protein
MMGTVDLTEGARTKACRKRALVPEPLRLMPCVSKEQATHAVKCNRVLTASPPLRALASQSKWERAVTLLQDMVEAGVPPDEGCYTGTCHAA